MEKEFAKNPLFNPNMAEQLGGMTSTTEGKAWWDWIHKTMLHEEDVTIASFGGLFFRAVAEKKEIHVFNSNRGVLKVDSKLTGRERAEAQELTIAQIINKIEGAADLARVYNRKSIDLNSITYYYANQESMLMLYISPLREERRFTINVFSFDEGLVNITKELVEKFVDLNPEEPELYIISEDHRGRPELQEIGRPAVELHRENYSDNVLEGYEYILEQLVAKEPFGRLVVIHGPPGTGKTYLVRSMVGALNLHNSMFVYMPPEFLTRFNIATLTRIFIEASSTGNQLVLLIEDGDEILVPRQADNIDAISKLLNFTDGFLSAMLDIRIIVTTNAKKPSIDPALKRPGRLCRILEVDKLSPEKASVIFKKNTGQDMSFDSGATLAEIYAEIYKHKGGGGETGDNPHRTTGFHLPKETKVKYNVEVLDDDEE